MCVTEFSQSFNNFDKRQGNTTHRLSGCGKYYSLDLFKRSPWLKLEFSASALSSVFALWLALGSVWLNGSPRPVSAKEEGSRVGSQLPVGVQALQPAGGQIVATILTSSCCGSAGKSWALRKICTCFVRSTSSSQERSTPLLSWEHTLAGVWMWRHSVVLMVLTKQRMK